MHTETQGSSVQSLILSCYNSLLELNSFLWLSSCIKWEKKKHCFILTRINFWCKNLTCQNSNNIYVFLKASTLIRTDSTELPDVFRHLPLSSITLDRSSKLHIRFTQSWCQSFLVGQHWHIHMPKSIEKRRLWVRPFFSSSASHVLFILFEWFLRWEIGDRTAAVFWNVISRICSREHGTFLWSSHLTFSLCVFSIHVVHL